MVAGCAGFARLLFHSPAFAIMDESTSAMDVPLEAMCLQRCIDRGIGILSVGHRPTLQAFHTHMLTLARAGKYTLQALEHVPALSVAYDGGEQSRHTGPDRPSGRGVAPLSMGPKKPQRWVE